MGPYNKLCRATRIPCTSPYYRHNVHTHCLSIVLVIITQLCYIYSIETTWAQHTKVLSSGATISLADGRYPCRERKMLETVVMMH